jgi:hypothetical protein
MNSFALRENIRRFRQLLAETLEPTKRRTVENLLAEEEAKLAAELRETPVSRSRPSE